MNTNSGKISVNKTLLSSAQALLDRLSLAELDFTTKSLAKSLQDELNDKYEADKRRMLYSLSKNQNESKENREIARQMYLDTVGYHIDYRWKEGNDTP
jgi:hypothetical protein